MRDSRRVWIAGGLGVAVLVAVVAGGALVARSRGASAELDRAVALIEGADRLVVEVDEVVRSQVTSELADPVAGAQPKVAQADDLLNEAIKVIEEASPRLSDEQSARASGLTQAATARLDMLAQAPAILDATAKAARALPLATAAWTRVLAADRLSDRAVSAYNKLTDAGVKESQRLNKQVATDLAAAREGFAQAEAAFPEADFEAYLAYVDLRIQLNGLSQRSDADWLAGELAKANAAIVTYNQLDARAVAAAKELPQTPESAVANAYVAVADAATDEYYAARERATEADRQLRGE